MPSMKFPAKPIFLINAKGQAYRLTPTRLGMDAATPTNLTIGPWLHSALTRMISWTDEKADGRKRTSTPNGKGLTSKPKRGYGKTARSA